MQKIILIIGGTGVLGQPIARHMKAAGFQVRIMTRNRQKASELFEDLCEIFEGNPTDARNLEQAVTGCYGVHISLPGEAEQKVVENVALVAPKHTVQRITYISGATVAEENRWFLMINRKFLAEKAIRDSGIPYTIFCPTWVMDSLPLFVNQGRAAIFGKQPHPFHWVAADDIAGMVAMAYHLEKATNKRLIIHGPEAILMREALQRYVAVFHPDIKEVSSMPFWLVRLMATFTHSQVLKEVGEMMSYFEMVGEGNQYPSGNGNLDAPKTTLELWLQKREHQNKGV